MAAKKKKTKHQIRDKPIAVPADIEIEPGAWDRFEKLVESAAKMGRKPHKGQKA